MNTQKIYYRKERITMENDNRNQNAPSSDNTSALFVSSRKKQLEEQEAQRILAEKEAIRLAQEAEVRRLEEAVQQRKLQAEEEAKRLASGQPPISNPIPPTTGNSIANDITSNLANATTVTTEKKPITADKKLLGIIIGGGVAGILLLTLIVQLATGGGLSQKTLAGDWYSTDGLSLVTFEDDSYQYTEYGIEDIFGTYKIEDDTVVLLHEDDPEVVVTSFNYIVDDESDFLYLGNYQFVRSEDYHLVEFNAAAMAEYLSGRWERDNRTIIMFPPESEASGWADIYENGIYTVSLYYEVTSDAEVIFYGDDDYYTYEFVSTTELMYVEDGVIMNKVSTSTDTPY